MTYEIFFNFLDSDWLVVPDNISAYTLIQLTILADYFCIPTLSQLCCNELLIMLNNENIEKILTHSITLKLNNVARACCDFWIKKATETIKLNDLKYEIQKVFGSKKKVVEQLESMMKRIGFDLTQVMMENEKNMPALSKKIFSSNSNMEKENYETNLYMH